MPSERDVFASRLLLATAFLVTVAALAWAVRAPVGPNADRYDYLGRAHHVLEGEGARPLVAYPLRFAFPGAESLPVENLTRPPLWPYLVAPALALGGDEASGVLVSGLALLTLLPVVSVVGNRAFGAGAGGFAALVIATSFATVRGLAGGGPELWLALLVALAWAWSVTGRGALDVLFPGVTLALMPWLHPIGGVYAALTWWARRGRTTARPWLLAGGLALVGGLPWYVHAGATTGTPLAPLQGHAELAKSLHDAGGLGPYRTLEPVRSVDVVTADPAAWLHHVAWNLKEQALGLDGWLAWTLVPLALLGTGRDPRRAARDAALGALAFAAVATVALDPRLLMPVLPVAALWAGAGYRTLVVRAPRHSGPPIAIALCIVPWLLPLGRTPLPGHGVRPLETPPATLEAVARSEAPVFTDAAILAWRARRLAVFVPASPDVLETLRTQRALRGPGTLVLTSGVGGPWLDAGWSAWIAARTSVAVGTARFVTLDPPRDTTYVPEALRLGPDDVPTDLVELDVPPASRAGIRVTGDTKRALDALLAAAKADGVVLRVISGYRSYARQSVLYASARERHGDDQRWVAAPGTSEHQLGTTVDFADAAVRHALKPSFETTPEARWLTAHAERFGFVRSYTAANSARTGYRPEAWHYRYRPELFESSPEDDG